MYSLRNRPEKLAEGSLFCLFLKLLQINFIFTDNVRILYISYHTLYINQEPEDSYLYIRRIKQKNLVLVLQCFFFYLFLINCISYLIILYNTCFKLKIFFFIKEIEGNFGLKSEVMCCHGYHHL